MNVSRRIQYSIMCLLLICLPLQTFAVVLMPFAASSSETVMIMPCHQEQSSQQIQTMDCEQCSLCDSLRTGYFFPSAPTISIIRSYQPQRSEAVLLQSRALSPPWHPPQDVFLI